MSQTDVVPPSKSVLVFDDFTLEVDEADLKIINSVTEKTARKALYELLLKNQTIADEFKILQQNTAESLVVRNATDEELLRRRIELEQSQLTKNIKLVKEELERVSGEYSRHKRLSDIYLKSKAKAIIDRTCAARKKVREELAAQRLLKRAEKVTKSRKKKVEDKSISDELSEHEVEYEEEDGEVSA